MMRTGVADGPPHGTRTCRKGKGGPPGALRARASAGRFERGAQPDASGVGLGPRVLRPYFTFMLRLYPLLPAERVLVSAVVA